MGFYKKLKSILNPIKDASNEQSKRMSGSDVVSANHYTQRCREDGCEYRTPNSTASGVILLLRLHYKCKHKEVKINLKEIAAKQAKPNSIIPNSRSKLTRENSNLATNMFDDVNYAEPFAIVYN